MQPCCSHNIFQELLQALPFVSLLLLSLRTTLKSAFQSAKSLWAQRNPRV